jgi:hypothetical protein
LGAQQSRRLVPLDEVDRKIAMKAAPV